MRTILLIFVSGTYLLMGQQDSGGLTARALFYREDTAAAAPAKAAKPKPAAPQTRTSSKRRPDTRPQESSTPANQGTVLPVAAHLGLRYNIVQVDPASGHSESVDSKKVFHQGDCIALRVESNAPGYLYVFDQGSSGRWQALLPSPEMPEESNLVKARGVMQVPAGYCFKFDNTPGVEKLFVVLSQNREAMQDINNAIRKGSPKTETPPPASGQLVLSASLLDRQVERMRAELQSRDLVIQRVAQPEASGEPAHAVYVVNAASMPSKRVVTEIRLQHE
jgi:hypothetical protein